jgi:O-antigen ligase
MWGGGGLGATAAFFNSRYVGLHGVHNGYLLLFFDTGLVGLGLVLLFLLTSTRKLLKHAQGESPERAYAHLGVALFAMFALTTLTESTFEGYAFSTLFMWVALAIAVQSPGARFHHKASAASIVVPC